MANNKIKGLTVEIGGDTTKLSEALSEVDKNGYKLQGNLKEVERLLKLDPSNTELLAERQKILAESVENTESKLAQLKEVQGQITAQYQSGEIDQGAYLAFQRELITTERQLDALNETIKQYEAVQESSNNAIAQMENSVDDAEQAINRYDEALDDAGQSVIDFGDLVKANLVSDLISSAFEKATEKSSKELLAMAERVGFSAEAYQEWDYIAKQAGTTMETLQGGITDLAEKMDDAASGTGEAAEIFEQLGLSVTDTTGNLKDQEQMFTEVVLALQNVEDASKRQALATKLMSTTGEELLPLLNGQIGSIDELKRSAHEMGAVLSDTALNEMATMENSFENLETKGINAATALVSKAAPLFSKMADFATENTDAIIALLSAYVAFTGANAIGNGIMTLVSSMKALKTANDAATVSQTAMNTAAAANPYVLVASAIAAVVAGLAIYATTADDVGNKIKDINKTVEQLQQNTHDTIADTEAEIKVIERKAERYEELRSIVNRTAAEESELSNLARELQTLLPEGTTLINEQSGAYLSLAGSIDSVTESMRRQATMNAYQEEYTALIKQQLEAEKAMEDAANEVYERTMKSQMFPNLPAFTGINAVSQAGLLEAQDDLEDATEAYNNISDSITDLEEKLKGLYGTSAETAEKMAEDSEEVQELAGDGLSGSLETYEENLNAKVASLDKSLKLRKKSEEQYYSELKKYLDENKNEESEAYFEQLSRYENYCEKKQNEAEKSNASVTKSNENAAKAAVKAYDTQLSEAKKYFDELHQQYKEGQIDREEYERQVTKLCSKYTEQRSELTEYAYSKDSELLKSTLEDITEDYENTLNDIQGKIDSFKSSVSGSFKSMLTFETKEGDALLPSAEEIRKRAEELGMTYQQYFNSAKYREDVKNAHWGREDSYIDKAYATDKIKSSTAELEEYLALIDNLRSRGISDGLISQLQNMSIEEGMATAKYYASLSDIQLRNLEKNWNKYNETAEKLASELYSDEVEAATEAYLSQVEEKLSECTPEMREAGLKIVQSLVAGFSDEEQAEQVTLKLNEMFGNAKQISETSGYDAGKIFAMKFAGGFEDNTQLVSASLQKVWNAAVASLGDMSVNFNYRNLNPTGIEESSVPQPSQNVTNTSFTQNIYAPKALSRAEIAANTRSMLQLANAR